MMQTGVHSSFAVGRDNAIIITQTNLFPPNTLLTEPIAQTKDLDPPKYKYQRDHACMSLENFKARRNSLAQCKPLAPHPSHLFCHGCFLAYKKPSTVAFPLLPKSQRTAKGRRYRASERITLAPLKTREQSRAMH